MDHSQIFSCGYSCSRVWVSVSVRIWDDSLFQWWLLVTIPSEWASFPSNSEVFQLYFMVVDISIWMDSCVWAAIDIGDTSPFQFWNQSQQVLENSSLWIMDPCTVLSGSRRIVIIMESLVSKVCTVQCVTTLPQSCSRGVHTSHQSMAIIGTTAPL
jgi:hypothetical protein